MRVSVSTFEYGAGLSRSEIAQLRDGSTLRTSLNQISSQHNRERIVTMSLGSRLRNEEGVDITYDPPNKHWKLVKQVDIVVSAALLAKLEEVGVYYGVRYYAEHTIDFMLE